MHTTNWVLTAFCVGGPREFIHYEARFSEPKDLSRSRGSGSKLEVLKQLLWLPRQLIPVTWAKTRDCGLDPCILGKSNRLKCQLQGTKLQHMASDGNESLPILCKASHYYESSRSVELNAMAT